MEQTPSCMFCKSGWPASHIRTHFPKAKANQLLKTKYNVEFRRDLDANYHSLVSLHTRTLGLTSKLNKLLETKKELESKIHTVNSEMISIQNILIDPASFESDVDQPPPCPNLGCRGLLDTNGRCVACGTTLCAQCKMPKTVNHVCDPGDLNSVQLISTRCKPCPVCRINILKVGGCDDMWCTRCKHAYSWRTGQLITVTARYHNPHFADESTIDGLWDVIRTVSMGTLRSRLKATSCDMGLICAVVQVYNNIVELRFEHMRHESRVLRSRKRYDDLQLKSIITEIPDDCLYKALRMIRNTIEKDELLVQSIQSYVQANGTLLCALYDLLGSDDHDVDLANYCETFQKHHDAFFSSGTDYTVKTDGRFPYVKVDTFRIARM